MMSPEMQKQIEKLNTCMESLLAHSKERDIKVDEIVARIEELAAQNNEMYKPFKDAVLVSKVVSMAIKWAFGTMLAIGGGYLMFKQIISNE